MFMDYIITVSQCLRIRIAKKFPPQKFYVYSRYVRTHVCAVLCCAVLCCAVLCCAVLCCVCVCVCVFVCVCCTSIPLPCFDSSRAPWGMVEGRLLQTRTRWSSFPRGACLSKKQVDSEWLCGGWSECVWGVDECVVGGGMEGTSLCCTHRLVYPAEWYLK